MRTRQAIRPSGDQAGKDRRSPLAWGEAFTPAASMTHSVETPSARVTPALADPSADQLNSTSEPVGGVASAGRSGQSGLRLPSARS